MTFSPAAAANSEAPDTAPSLCSWLLEKKAAATQSVPSPAGVAPQTSSHASVSQIANYVRSGDAAELQGCVVRDIHFVTTQSDAKAKRKAAGNDNADDDDEEEAAREPHTTQVHHAVLDSVLGNAANTTTNDDADAAAARLARLRYASIAESLHPVTVFLLLDVYSKRSTKAEYADNEAEGLVLALASILSAKTGLHTSLGGTLHRAADLRSAAQDYFAARLRSRLLRLRYGALLCRATCSAIATGALRAASLLCAVSDMAVLHAFGLSSEEKKDDDDNDKITEKGEEYDEEEIRRLEAEVMEAIGFIHQYAQWALQSAATSLGVLSAHVGSPSQATKEASLRDGKAHPIVTSRTVEIEPLRLARPAYGPSTTAGQ